MTGKSTVATGRDFHAEKNTITSPTKLAKPGNPQPASAAMMGPAAMNGPTEAHLQVLCRSVKPAGSPRRDCHSSTVLHRHSRRRQSHSRRAADNDHLGTIELKHPRVLVEPTQF
jgi:hypothetical protein